MPVITINGLKVELTVPELIEYQALAVNGSQQPIEPVHPTAAPAGPFRVAVPPPASTAPAIAKPAAPPKKIPKKKNPPSKRPTPEQLRKKLEDKGFSNVIAVRAATKVLAELTTVLPEVRSTAEQDSYLLARTSDEVDEINNLVGRIRKNYAVKHSPRKAWLPGIIAAVWAIKLEGDKKQYEILKTRFSINDEFIELVSEMSHKPYEDTDVLGMQRARLNPQAKQTLFTDLYTLFSDKDFKIGNTK